MLLKFLSALYEVNVCVSSLQDHAKGGKCIVFTQTKRDADRLSYTMGRSVQCQALHGDITQAQRERTLQGFREGRFNTLIATDVAARGLDIPNVDLVSVFLSFPLLLSFRRVLLICLNLATLSRRNVCCQTP